MREIDFQVILKLKLGKADSATSDYLDGFDRQLSLQPRRLEPAQERIVYEFTHTTLGELGRFVFRNLKDSETSFKVEGPEITSEKSAAVRAGRSSREQSETRETKRKFRLRIYQGLLNSMMLDGLIPWPKIARVLILEPFTEQRTQRSYQPGESYTPKKLGWDERRCIAYAARGKVELTLSASPETQPAGTPTQPIAQGDGGETKPERTRRDAIKRYALLEVIRRKRNWTETQVIGRYWGHAKLFKKYEGNPDAQSMVTHFWTMDDTAFWKEVNKEKQQADGRKQTKKTKID